MTHSPIVDKTMELFSQMMIEKLENMSSNTKWQQPWFSESAMQLPVNISGRNYNGMNTIMLLMQQEKQGYKHPVWGTFNRFTSYNYDETTKKPLTDKEGNPLPRVCIRKGETSFPIVFVSFSVFHKETKERMTYDEYRQLERDEQDQYDVFPRANVYRVFNIEQTNLAEVRPELFAKLTGQHQGKSAEERKEMFKYGIIDSMIEHQSWLCPINLMAGNKSFYSITKDTITLPEFQQFKDGESFYGTLLHEMAHSTGSEQRLGRLKDMNQDKYASEELVAELTAALIMTRHGMPSYVKQDSLPYLKSWLGELRKSPDFINSVLTDVKRAAHLIESTLENVESKIAITA